jgi:pentatricopeptide repeat protein
VLHTAARHGLVVLANEAIMRLQEAGITWQEHHVAPLVEAFARAGRVKEAFGALDLMLAAGVQPSPETTIPILDHIRDNSDKIDEAWGILEDIHEEGLAAASKPAEGATPVAAKTIHITSINVIIHAAAMMGDLQRAVGVYKAATSLGAVPDINTYDHLLLACVPGANRELADQLLSELRAARITPSQRTYEALMQVCLYQYSYEDAFFYLEEMKAQGHAPRPGVYEQLVMRLIKRGDARWKLALDEMKECGYTLSVEFQRRMDAARAAPGEDVSVAADEDGQQAIESSAKAFVEDMMMSGRKTSS